MQKLLLRGISLIFFTVSIYALYHYIHLLYIIHHIKHDILADLAVDFSKAGSYAGCLSHTCNTTSGRAYILLEFDSNWKPSKQIKKSLELTFSVRKKNVILRDVSCQVYINRKGGKTYSNIVLFKNLPIGEYKVDVHTTQGIPSLLGHTQRLQVKYAMLKEETIAAISVSMLGANFFASNPA